MKILANQKIKSLFLQVLASVAAAAMLLDVLVLSFPKYTVAEIVICAALLCALLAVFLYRYFRDQNDTLENAEARIEAYLSGDHAARLESDEDGELYRLFHEMNTLVSVLNAHAENEGRAKQSLQNTFADISHQLKTPLAALNIYVGILQEEAREQPEIREFTDLSEQELDRMEALVQNLLKIAKLDAGTITFEMREENLSEMVRAIEKQFSVRCRQEEKRLELSGDEELRLSCDRTWLTEAIGNLVKNAFDHVSELRNMIESKAGNQLTFSDKRESNQDTENTYWAFTLFVYAFLAVVAMITVLNIVNSISLSVSARIRQYGYMRAVGMDTKQMMRMIVSETVTYGLSGLIVGCAIGLPLNEFLFRCLITGYFALLPYFEEKLLCAFYHFRQK